MGKGQRQDNSVVDDLFELLASAPVWFGPVIAFVLFATCRLGIPLVLSATASDNDTGRTLTQVWSDMAVKFAPLVGGGVLLIWVSSGGSQVDQSKAVRPADGNRHDSPTRLA